MSEVGLSILLVEDNPADAMLISVYLEELGGVVVSRVDSFRSAMALLAETHFDLALLDLNLPDARGLSGLERIATAYPELPVVVLTGFAGDDIAIAGEAVRLGAQDYLFKGGIEPPMLERSLRLAVERKRLELYRLRWAREDPSTGLPRLQVLEERFERARARSVRGRTWLALLHIGVDGLSCLAETAGRDHAEAHFRVIAARLAKGCRKADCLARLDGAHLALMAESIKHASDAFAVARKCLATARKPIEVDGQTRSLSLSIGLDAIGPSRACPDLGSLLVSTERAMIAAQEAGGGGCHPTDALSGEALPEAQPAAQPAAHPAAQPAAKAEPASANA